MPPLPTDNSYVIRPTVPMAGLPDIPEVVITGGALDLLGDGTTDGFVVWDLLVAPCDNEVVLRYGLPPDASGEPAWEFAVQRLKSGDGRRWRILSAAYEVQTPAGYVCCAAHVPLSSGEAEDTLLRTLADRGRLHLVRYDSTGRTVLDATPACISDDFGAGLAGLLRDGSPAMTQ